MKGRITILCENSAGPLSGTLGEHGFAALVEHDSGALLFDTGQGATLIGNARRMNKDLDRVAMVALSHGHYDHTGGLLPLLQACGSKEIYAHPDVFVPRYRVKDNGESIAIGMPYARELLADAGAAFNLGREFREIAPGMFLTGEVPRLASFEQGDHGLFLDTAGTVADPINDDQSLIIRTDNGLVLLLGCCHAGIVNTVELAVARTGVAKIVAIIGGTHLGFCGAQQLEETLGRLHSYRIQKFCAGHCTGFSASARLHREFPGKFHPANVGYTLEV
jgi:7,8-dihydropterin-6-yl-methyl-4-(beta-D-ribofuranosyl)aminobenzene 5'-phosphate synthase